jgi:hypothetical protein
MSASTCQCVATGFTVIQDFGNADGIVRCNRCDTVHRSFHSWCLCCDPYIWVGPGGCVDIQCKNGDVRRLEFSVVEAMKYGWRPSVWQRFKYWLKGLMQ